MQVQGWLCWWSCHCVARKSTNYSSWLAERQSALTGCPLSNQKHHLPTSQPGDIETLSEKGRRLNGEGKMPFIRPPWATSWYLSAKHSQEEEERDKQPLSLFHSTARSPPKCWLPHSHFVSDIQLHNTQKSSCSRKRRRTNRLNWKVPVIVWLKSFHELWCKFKKALQK